jgi:hypothetical protein
MLQPVPKPKREHKDPKRLQQRTPIAQRNGKRQAKQRKANFPDRPENVRCAIAEQADKRDSIPADWQRCWGAIEPAHVVHARGMGGCNSSRDEVVWLCHGHHREQEGRGPAFEARYGVDLKALAAETAARSSP